MKHLGIIVWLLLLAVGIALAAELEDPPPNIDADTYRWEKAVARRFHVLTTTTRLPINGRVSGMPGQLLLSKTSTNKGILHINISPGPGEGDSWGEVLLR